MRVCVYVCMYVYIYIYIYIYICVYPYKLSRLLFQCGSKSPRYSASSLVFHSLCLVCCIYKIDRFPMMMMMMMMTIIIIIIIIIHYIRPEVIITTTQFVLNHTFISKRFLYITNPTVYIFCSFSF